MKIGTAAEAFDFTFEIAVQQTSKSTMQRFYHFQAIRPMFVNYRIERASIRILEV